MQVHKDNSAVYFSVCLCRILILFQDIDDQSTNVTSPTGQNSSIHYLGGKMGKKKYKQKNVHQVYGWSDL